MTDFTLRLESAASEVEKGFCKKFSPDNFTRGWTHHALHTLYFGFATRAGPFEHTKGFMVQKDFCDDWVIVLESGCAYVHAKTVFERKRLKCLALDVLAFCPR